MEYGALGNPHFSTLQTGFMQTWNLGLLLKSP